MKYKKYVFWGIGIFLALLFLFEMAFSQGLRHNSGIRTSQNRIANDMTVSGNITMSTGKWIGLSSTTTRIVFNATGIGININDPIRLLHIASSFADNECYIDSYSTSAGHRAMLTFRHSKNNTVGTATTTTTGFVFGEINFRGVDSGSSFDLGAKIKAVQDGTAGSRVPTNLILGTYSSTAENTNQMVLHNDGNIGIGTDAPERLLDIKGGSAGSVNSDSDTDLLIEDDANAAITFLSPDNLYGRLYFGSPGDALYAHIDATYGSGTPVFDIGTNHVSGIVKISSGDKVPAISIDASGNIDITNTGTLSGQKEYDEWQFWAEDPENAINDTSWQANQFKGTDVTVDSIKAWSMSTDDFDFTIVYRAWGGGAPTVIHAVQVSDDGTDCYTTTITSVTQGTIPTNSQIGIVKSADAEDQYGCVLFINWVDQR